MIGASAHGSDHPRHRRLCAYSPVDEPAGSGRHRHDRCGTTWAGRPEQLAGSTCDPGHRDLEHGDLLRAHGHSLLRADGKRCQRIRDEPGSLQRRQRLGWPDEGRSRARDRARMHRLCGLVRIVRGIGTHDRPCRAAGNVPLRLRPKTRRRCCCRRRHARNPDSAVHGVRDLCHSHRGIHWKAVSRRCHSGDHSCVLLSRRHLDPDCPETRNRTSRALPRLA